MPTLTLIRLLEKKRRGEPHTQDEIRFLVESAVDGTAADYQIAAWLMAACIQGLNLDETTWLTQYFAASGTILDWAEAGVSGTVVDKHSTGGVGDKTTLVLTPMLAACGVKVAKLAGRGLGFTGGTIDKLEAIPGFRPNLSRADFIQQLNRTGIAISGQTADLAPADGRFYALRDVTATVDSIPLIAASVVSKKIAAGAPVIVLDIKAGRGAFMKTPEDALALADTCRDVGRRLGKSLATVVSSMEQPLGYAVGHAVEVAETIRTLQGQGPADLVALCLQLGAVALVGAGRAETLAAGEAALKQCLEDGSALACFRELVIAQGGDPECIADTALLPQPDRITLVPSPQRGYIADIDPLKIAQAAKLLGAGRDRADDALNLGVGVVLHKKVGESVEEGARLVELYVGDRGHSEALELVKSAFTFSPVPVAVPPLILDVTPAQAEALR